MDSLTDLQRYRFDEVIHVLSEDAAAIRWAIKTSPSMQEHDPSGPDRIIRLNLTIHNLGENDVTIKAQHSDSDITDNNPPYPGNFEATFSDIAGTSKAVKNQTAQELTFEVTKPYVQLYGSGPATLRIQGHCLAPISIIGINDGKHS